jgi:hypothetical protein
LRVVNLSRNPLGDEGLRAIVYNLAFSPSIEQLDLSRVTATSGNESVAEALEKLFRICVTLTTLNCAFCSFLFIFDVNFFFIYTVWKTKVATSFTKNTILALGQNRSLTHLDISEIGTLSVAQVYFIQFRFRPINLLLISWVTLAKLWL